MMRLTEEQRKIVESKGGGIAVLAGAGCGKTTTLVNKCEAFLQQKPDARICAVSFTERSAGDLREKISSRFPLTGHWVTTIHGLCSSILREYPQAAELDGEEDVLSEPEAQILWERVLDRLWYEDLPSEIEIPLSEMMRRESRESLSELIQRTRSLIHYQLHDSAEEQRELKALLTVTQYALSDYERMKRSRGVLDFEDLELLARKILREPQVRKDYHRRFDLVLVDEFQDTNPIQGEIISHFVRPDWSNLIVVGDPKQSIYRFRDADVSVFEEFCQKLPSQLELTKNFRSHPKIIEFTNRVCAPAFAEGGQEYIPLVAGIDSEGASEAVEEPVVELEVESPHDLARYLLKRSKEGMALEDTVLLLRRIRGGNEKWLKALSAAGLPVAVGSGGLFWGDPRVRELTALLKWMDQKENRFSAAIFLRAPWVGIPDEQLDEWLRELSGSEVFEKFIELDHPVSRVICRERVRPGEFLMHLLREDPLAEKLEAEMGVQLLALWHRCEELSSSGLGFSAVVRELSRAMEEGRRERELPPPRNKGQLSVLTLHASKGLEFPHVLLLDLTGKFRAAPSPLLYWDRHQGAFLAKRSADGSRIQKDPEEKSWKEKENLEILAESRRLFYVAVTRPQKQLILVKPPLQKESDPETVYSENNWRGWIDHSGLDLPSVDLTRWSFEAVKALPSESGVAPSPLPKPPAIGLKRSRHSVTELNLLTQCERSYEWKFRRKEESQPFELESPRRDSAVQQSLSVGTSVRELGTAIHQSLENEDWNLLREVTQASPIDPQKIQNWSETSALLKDVQTIWNEPAFEVPFEGEVVVGALDRLIETQAGEFRLLDFKVTLEGVQPEELIRKYKTQIQLYVWAVSEMLPRSKGKITPYLISISSEGVREIEVEREKGWTPGALLQRSLAILSAGECGQAMPGKICRVCDFRNVCNVSQY